MSKLPRLVLAAGLGVGTFLAVDGAIERQPEPTYAVERVNACVGALGDKAVTAVALQMACSSYADNFVPTAVGTNNQVNQTLTFKLPTPVELLKSEGGEAALIDQNIVQSNANARGEELLLSGLAGLAIAFAFGNFKPIKKLDSFSTRKQKKVSQSSNAIKV